MKQVELPQEDNLVHVAISGLAEFRSYVRFSKYYDRRESLEPFFSRLLSYVPFGRYRREDTIGFECRYIILNRALLKFRDDACIELLEPILNSERSIQSIFEGGDAVDFVDRYHTFLRQNGCSGSSFFEDVLNDGLPGNPHVCRSDTVPWDISASDYLYTDEDTIEEYKREIEEMRQLQLEEGSTAEEDSDPDIEEYMTYLDPSNYQLYDPLIESKYIDSQGDLITLDDCDHYDIEPHGGWGSGVFFRDPDTFHGFEDGHEVKVELYIQGHDEPVTEDALRAALGHFDR